MLLIERLVSLYAPHSCLECGKENDRLACVSCSMALPHVPSRCYRCHAVTRDYAVCGHCRRTTPLSNAYVAMHYEGLAKELLHHTKYERARSGVSEIADLMTPLLSLLPEDAILVPVPTATSRVRQRGYDQADLLAAELARRSGRPVVRALARLGQAHQVGASRTERINHLRDAFRVTGKQGIAGKHCIVVDDVLTTGATIETAARLLRKSGAKRVDTCVFCQA
jgi:ComF family protein